MSPHAAGISLLEEVEQLTPLRKEADTPYVVILGGAKAEDKSPILEDMIDRCSAIIIGGLVAVTYLAAMNHKTGAHTVDQKQIRLAQRCIRKAHEKKVTFHLPIDFVNQKREVKPITQLSETDLMLDIGPETLAAYDRVIHRANTIFWNGAMGKSEEIAFARGTIRLAHSIGISGADVRIASGGDTVGAIHEHKLHKAFTFLSTGGGATLEYVAGRDLPGLVALAK
jgi:phosphoglycerate kinase